MFLLFNSEEEAQEACNRIVTNIRSWMSQNYPARIHPQGLVSVGLDGQPRLNATVTTAWDIPKQYQEGWLITKPEQKDTGLIPVAIVLEGVDGEELEVATPFSDRITLTAWDLISPRRQKH